jgi:DNA-directed RNA polymerase III subunit RPC8
LAIFRPKLNELLLGRVHSSTPMGLQVSLSFFQDVTVPTSNLRDPSVFDERLQTWIWQYKDETGKIVPYAYKEDEIVCVRVRSVQFTDSQNSSLEAARRAQAMSSSKSFTPSNQVAHSPQEIPPMLVVASVEEPGLGLVSWWI